MLLQWTTKNYIKLTKHQKTDAILQRANDRCYFYTMLIKLFGICYERFTDGG